MYSKLSSTQKSYYFYCDAYLGMTHKRGRRLQKNAKLNLKVIYLYIFIQIYLATQFQNEL